jgi:Resolvase, N terminal domain
LSGRRQVGQKPLQGRPVEVATREAAIVVALGQANPAGVRLALDVSLGRFALGVQNTATSMGRLVLNVLLSFAQFEREIIAERTRDKIAAARRRGKWAGGMPRVRLIRVRLLNASSPCFSAVRVSFFLT